MRRLLKIARREYVAYVRTFGFWLSMALMPVGFGLFSQIPFIMERNAPVPVMAVVDLTGENLDQALPSRLAEALTAGEKPIVVLAPAPSRGSDLVSTTAALKPFVAGERLLPDGRKLTAAAILHGSGAQPRVDLWNANVGNRDIGAALRDALSRELRARQLVAAGFSVADIKALDHAPVTITDFSPKAEGAVTLRDRLPGIIGFAMGMLLWAVVFTGAGILLNSVIEEKSSRILEVLLSSASVPEIMFGKILGVAAVTLTVLGVWASLGGVALASLNPGIAADVAAVIFERGLIFYFLFYLIGGYLMYAAVFTAIGAFCETTREAQTMLGPMMILLTIPVAFMAQTIQHPDAPILELLSWIPPFTPFLMTARAASQPPLWQVAATGVLMLATTAAVVWAASRAFRAGALSTGKLDLKAVIGKLRRPD